MKENKLSHWLVKAHAKNISAQGQFTYIFYPFQCFIHKDYRNYENNYDRQSLLLSAYKMMSYADDAAVDNHDTCH